MQVVSKKTILAAYKDALAKVNADSVKRNLGPEPYFVEYLKMMRDVLKNKRDKNDRESSALITLSSAIEERKKYLKSSEESHRKAFYKIVSENIEEWTDAYADI